MATKKKTVKSDVAAAKASAKKPASKKPLAEKAPVKKATAKKAAAKKPAKKMPAKKGACKKPAAKKAAEKKKAAQAKAPKKAAKQAQPKKAVDKKVVVPVATRSLPLPPKKKMLAAPKNAQSKQYSQSELYDSIKGYCGFASRSDAKSFYGEFTEMLQSALKAGYKLALPGLGKLQVRKTKQRKGINPATREPIVIPAKRKVAFTASKALKEAVL